MIFNVIVVVVVIFLLVYIIGCLCGVVMKIEERIKIHDTFINCIIKDVNKLKGDCNND